MDEQKTCTGCKLPKSLDAFNKDAQKSDGLRPECKLCKSKRDEIYRENNEKKIKKIQKKYYAQNSEKIKQKSRDWNANNFERAKQNRKAWHDNNKDKVDYLRAKHIEENKVFYQEYQRNYQKNRYHNNINYRMEEFASMLES